MPPPSSLGSTAIPRSFGRTPKGVLFLTFLLAGLHRVLIGLDHLLKHDTRTNSIRKQDFKKSFKSFVHSALYILDHSRR